MGFWLLMIRSIYRTYMKYIKYYNVSRSLFASCVSLEDENVRLCDLMMTPGGFCSSSVLRGCHSVPSTLRTDWARRRLPPSKLRPSGGCSLWTWRPGGRPSEDGTVHRGEERKCHSSDGEQWRNPEERSGGGRRQQNVWNHGDLYRL